MILQGRFNSVFTPHSLAAMSGHTKSNLYLVDGDPNHNHDPFVSSKTISIEYKCERSYVGYEKWGRKIVQKHSF